MQTVSRRRGKPRKLTQSWELVISFLKARLSASTVFSLPAAEYAQLLVEPEADEINVNESDPWQTVLDLSAMGTKEFEIETAPQTTCFEIVNAAPQQR